MPTITITEANLDLSDIERQFKLKRNDDPLFFSEWHLDLSPLSPEEIAYCDRIKRSYLHNRFQGIQENAINLLVISPLLYLAGCLEPPYKVRTEQSVEIAVTDQDLDQDVIYKGRIDTLVIQEESQNKTYEQLWIVVIESKRPKLNFFEAVPQALTYMMASPNGDLATYAIATNGDGFIFIKRQGHEYAFSSDFSMFSQPNNQLYVVLQILKKITANF